MYLYYFIYKQINNLLFSFTNIRLSEVPAIKRGTLFMVPKGIISEDLAEGKTWGVKMRRWPEAMQQIIQSVSKITHSR